MYIFTFNTAGVCGSKAGKYMLTSTEALQYICTQILKCSIYSGGQLERAANNQEYKGSVGHL
jgi:hypothetical protein